MSSSLPAHTGAESSEASVGGKERQKGENSKKRQQRGITQGHRKDRGRKTFLVLSTESGGEGGPTAPALLCPGKWEWEHSLGTKGDSSGGAQLCQHCLLLMEQPAGHLEQGTARLSGWALPPAHRGLSLWLPPNHGFDFWCSRLERRSECCNRWEKSWAHHIHEKRKGK